MIIVFNNKIIMFINNKILIVKRKAWLLVHSMALAPPPQHCEARGIQYNRQS